MPFGVNDNSKGNNTNSDEKKLKRQAQQPCKTKQNKNTNLNHQINPGRSANQSTEEMKREDTKPSKFI